MVEVEDLLSSGRPEPDRGDEPPGQEFLDEVVDLLSVSDARERGVLPADEHAGMQRDGCEKARLASGESAARDRPYPSGFCSCRDGARGTVGVEARDIQGLVSGAEGHRVRFRPAPLAAIARITLPSTICSGTPSRTAARRNSRAKLRS
jgi:hypothetical protein